VSELIQITQPKEILDLKARKGYFSILAASYGAHVDVVDDVINNGEYPDYLKVHPNITFFDSKVENFKFKKKYDFIIMKHIAMFYPKEFIIDELMQNIHDHLVRGGITFLTYHYPDSYAMMNDTSLYQYDLDDFKSLKGKFVVKDFGNYYNPVP
jgi:2-polyprenyl-3-methyl-5-hydroxy-6-metoxy-1,4-benzoquinol methylase